MEGRTISHYRVLEKLGEGGMGEVYLAEDTSLKRNVAIKVLPGFLQQDPISHKRFIREAQSAAALDHPYICHINEVGQTDDGQDFICMEYVEGETLKQRLEKGRIPLKEALSVASEIAEALEEAHQKNIIHRDLKPANIMVTASGHIKVMDFGLAKKFVKENGNEEDITSMLTREGSTLGTLAYMSPEQIRAEMVDHRSDIFSFGIVLYETVTGIHPFRKATQADTSAALLTRNPPPLSEYVEEYPELFQHTVQKMLAKNPDQRYQSIHEVRTNLDRLLQAAPQTGVAWWKWVAVSAVAVMVLLAVLFSWLYLRSPLPDQAGVPLRPQPLTSYEGVERYPSFSPDGETIAFSWFTGGIAEIYFQRIGDETPIRRTEASQEDRAAAWSPDGSHLAFIRRAVSGEKPSVYLTSPFGGPEQNLGEIAEFSILAIHRPRLAWVPDGRSLVVSDRERPEEPCGLFRLSIETGQRCRLTRPPARTRGDFSPAFSPDGRTLAFVRARTSLVGDLYLLSLDEGFEPVGEELRLTDRNSFLTQPTWAGEGKEIVFCAGPDWVSNGLWRVSCKGDQSPVPLPFAMEGAWDPEISRQGDRLVYAFLPMEFNIYRLDIPPPEGEATAPVKVFSSSRFDFPPVYSPDGERVAFSSNRQGKFEIYTCAPDGSGLKKVTSLGGFATSPAWSPDGSRIAFQFSEQGTPDIYVVNSKGGEAKQLTSDPAEDSNPWWSMEGEWIHFSSNRGGSIEKWRLPAEGGEAEPALISPDEGRYESLDTEYLFFEDKGGIWQVPSDGGEPSLIVARGRILKVVEDGFYYWRHKPESLTFRFHSIRSGEDQLVASVEGAVLAKVSRSPDGQSVLFSRWDNKSSGDLMLVEEFK